MRTFLSFTVVVMFLLTTVSCKKEETAATPSTPIDLLTNGSSKRWGFTSNKVNGTELLGNCSSDDAIIFTKSTLKYAHTKGTKKCNNDDNDESSAFVLSADGKSLRMFNDNFTVVSLDKNTLQISVTLPSFNQILTFRAL